MANIAAVKESLGSGITATGAQGAVSGRSGYKTYSAWGTTGSGSGSATVVIQGSNSGGAAWVTIGTLTLTLGTSASEDGFTSADVYESVRMNVTAISGTGASVSAAQSH
jgi:hypothetical protein